MKKEFNSKKNFEDIPYKNYAGCDKVLQQLLKELGLKPVVAKNKTTSDRNKKRHCNRPVKKYRLERLICFREKENILKTIYGKKN